MPSVGSGIGGSANCTPKENYNSGGRAPQRLCRGRYGREWRIVIGSEILICLPLLLRECAIHIHTMHSTVSMTPILMRLFFQMISLVGKMHWCALSSVQHTENVGFKFSKINIHIACIAYENKNHYLHIQITVTWKLMSYRCTII